MEKEKGKGTKKKIMPTENTENTGNTEMFNISHKKKEIPYIFLSQLTLNLRSHEKTKYLF